MVRSYPKNCGRRSATGRGKVRLSRASTRERWLLIGGQGGGVRGRGAGEAAQVVATFEQGDDAAIRVPIGNPANLAGERGKVIVGQLELPERVAGSRIEAGGDQDELGTEFVGSRNQLLLERREDFFVAGASGGRAIDRRSQPRAGAGFVG